MEFLHVSLALVLGVCQPVLVLKQFCGNFIALVIALGRDYLAVITYAVVDQVAVRVVRVMVSYQNKLSVFYPISSMYSRAILAINSSVSNALSSALKLNAICPTGCFIFGLSSRWKLKLSVISRIFPSNTPSESMISALSLPIT